MIIPELSSYLHVTEQQLPAMINWLSCRVVYIFVVVVFLMTALISVAQLHLMRQGKIKTISLSSITHVNN